MNNTPYTVITNFAIQYTYLLSSLILLLIFLLLYFFNTHQRRLMLLSGILSAPFAFGSIFFVPEYWEPIRIAQFGAGIEDILFAFSTGGIVWFCSTFLIRHYIYINTETTIFIKRYVIICISGFIMYVVLENINGLGVMTNTLISIFIHGIILYFFQLRLWIIPLSGGIIFGTAYTFFVAIIFYLNPHFVTQWNLDNLTGILVLGFPIEETLWAVAFGMVWPLFMSYVFNVGYNLRGTHCYQ